MPPAAKNMGGGTKEEPPNVKEEEPGFSKPRPPPATPSPPLAPALPLPQFCGGGIKSRDPPLPARAAMPCWPLCHCGDSPGSPVRCRFSACWGAGTPTYDSISGQVAISVCHHAHTHTQVHTHTHTHTHIHTHTHTHIHSSPAQTQHTRAYTPGRSEQPGHAQGHARMLAHAETTYSRQQVRAGTFARSQRDKTNNEQTTIAKRHTPRTDKRIHTHTHTHTHTHGQRTRAKQRQHSR